MKKKVIYDMLLNIVATAIPIIVLQLFILPRMSIVMGDSKYGLFVTIIAFVNTVPATFGNVINNIRLIFQNKYDEKKVKGDFSLITMVLIIANIVAVAVFTLFYKSEDSFGGLILTIIMTTLWLLREYYIVAYRIKINYLFITINNAILTIGYVFGYWLFLKCEYWQIVYLTALILSLIFIVFTTDIWKEPFRKTELFKEVSIQSVWLLVAGLLGRIISYADKLLLYPLLGGTIVAIYYSATIFGKIVSLAIGPISSVALTYLAKMKTKSNKLFGQTLLISSVFCIVGYIFCVAISKPVLQWLYPQYISEAIKYIHIVTAASIFGALISIVNPFILKFFDMKWQIVLSAGTVIIYITLCLALLKIWGLMGFCVGTLLTNVIKLIVMIIIYISCNTSEEKKKLLKD